MTESAPVSADAVTKQTTDTNTGTEDRTKRPNHLYWFAPADKPGTYSYASNNPTPASLIGHEVSRAVADCLGVDEKAFSKSRRRRTCDAINDESMSTHSDWYVKDVTSGKVLADCEKLVTSPICSIGATVRGTKRPGFSGVLGSGQDTHLGFKIFRAPKVLSAEEEEDLFIAAVCHTRLQDSMTEARSPLDRLRKVCTSTKKTAPQATRIAPNHHGTIAFVDVGEEAFNELDCLTNLSDYNWAPSDTEQEAPSASGSSAVPNRPGSTEPETLFASGDEGER